MPFKAYVINLEKRKERLENFKNAFEKYGPGTDTMPLEIIKAIDGTNHESIQSLKMFLKENTDFETGLFDLLDDTNNDYNGNPRIFACALSHITAWKKIADGDTYGIIFEDDVNFREDSLFKKVHKKYFEDIIRLDNAIDRPHVVYLGIGDILPIHIGIKSESLMRSQEKSHIKEFINDSIGIPKEKSAFVFDWFGAFSYCLSPTDAKYLLDCLKQNSLKKAVDVYIKDTMKSYVVWPLLTYHDRLETCESDIVTKA